MRFRIGVLSSPGGGLTRRLIQAATAPDAPFEVVRVMAAAGGAPVLATATAAGVPAQGAPEGAALWETFDADSADGVLLLGWLRLLDMPDRWQGRVINAHPGLLPAFGGKGLWGHHVHAEVLASGSPVTAASYHVVDGEYDHGPVVHQVEVRVLPDDDVASLQARVLEVQHQSLVPFVTAWARGELHTAGLASHPNGSVG